MTRIARAMLAVTTAMMPSAVVTASMPSAAARRSIAALARSPLGTESLQTRRWREVDSNFQFLATLGGLAGLRDPQSGQRRRVASEFARLFAGGDWIRNFSSAL